MTEPPLRYIPVSKERADLNAAIRGMSARMAGGDAQTSQEPAVSPPGEVTTSYLDELCRWRETPEGLRAYKPDSSDDLKGYWSVNAAWQAATLDIRANVERETAKLRAEVEMLKGELAKANEGKAWT